MMLNPRHTCWWTAQRRTDLVWDGHALHGAGVSLHVLLHAFLSQEYVWYTIRYGDFDDNVICIGVAAQSVPSFGTLVHPDTSPIALAFGGSQPVHEYLLSEQVLRQLGCSVSANHDSDRWDLTNAAMDLHDPRIRVKIHLHDDCFFSIEPLDPAGLSQVVVRVLQLHSFYLNTPVQWSAAQPYIQEQLVSHGQLRLVSHVRRQHLRVAWPNRARSHVARILRPRNRHTVNIIDTCATVETKTS